MTNREIDALVYRKVFGGKLCRHIADEYGKCKRCGLNKSFWTTIAPPGRYTTDPAAAFQVVDALLRKGMHFGLDTSGTTFEAYFVANGRLHTWASPNPATAICHAALAALGVEGCLTSSLSRGVTP